MARRKLAEGADMPPSDKPEASFTDLQLEEANQMGTGSSHAMDRSVYLSVCRRNSRFGPKAYYPLYKVEVAAGSSSSRKLHRIGKLETDVGAKTFISLPSPPGWIIGVGGDSSGTIIVDTTSEPPRVIQGPNLVAAKCCPVVAAVGSKVYALSTSPNYLTEPDFVPWFEVLDLSKANVTKAADGSPSLVLDGCFWEELPCPVFFPHKLTPRGYCSPPNMAIRSHVVVLPYILISLNLENSCTYAFDTNSGEWHKVHDKYLPFIGPAIPHGHSGHIFLGSSLKTGSTNAYHIHVRSTSSSSSSSTSTVSGGSALKLSITAIPLKHETDEQVGTMEEHFIASFDIRHFCLLTFLVDSRISSLRHYSDTDERISGIYSRKLFVKLTTYKIQSPEEIKIQSPEETDDEEDLPDEIAISTLREQDFKVSSNYGFASPPISFALSI